MQALVLVALALTLSALMWQLVHSAPRVLSMVLPTKVTLAAGGLVFFLGTWRAFAASTVLRDPAEMLFALLGMYVGLWFMLAPSAGMRGSESDERFLRRLFAMIGLVTAALIGSLYLGNPSVAVLQLLMIAGGFWVTMDYLRLTDRGG